MPETRLSELLLEHADYLESYVGFVGNNLEIARVMREAASEIESLGAQREGLVKSVQWFNPLAR